MDRHQRRMHDELGMVVGYLTAAQQFVEAGDWAAASDAACNARNLTAELCEKLAKTRSAPSRAACSSHGPRDRP